MGLCIHICTVDARTHARMHVLVWMRSVLLSQITVVGAISLVWCVGTLECTWYPSTANGPVKGGPEGAVSNGGL